MVVELKIDLFKYIEMLDFSKDIVFICHCISHDLKMGAGIAKPMQEKFSIREKAPPLGIWVNKGYAFIVPSKLFLHEGPGIVNLVTKEYYYNKPTYSSLNQSLEDAKNIISKVMNENCNKYKTPKIIMPKIGCGLDRLEWSKVKEILSKQFNNLNVVVCYL